MDWCILRARTRKGRRKKPLKLTKEARTAVERRRTRSTARDTRETPVAVHGAEPAAPIYVSVDLNVAR